jgi:hypothetical protein
LAISLENNSMELSSASDIAGLRSDLPAGSVTPTRSSLNPISLLKLVFSFPAMLGGLLVAMVFWAKHDFNVDTDFWWHLRVGEDIL